MLKIQNRSTLNSWLCASLVINITATQSRNGSLFYTSDVTALTGKKSFSGSTDREEIILRQ